MAANYTYSEIANNWNLWQTYVDPNGEMTEAEFDAMSEADKIQIQTDSFGPEMECSVDGCDYRTEDMQRLDEHAEEHELAAAI